MMLTSKSISGRDCGDFFSCKSDWLLLSVTDLEEALGENGSLSKMLKHLGKSLSCPDTYVAW